MTNFPSQKRDWSELKSAATAANELCRFVQQRFGTSELDPIEGHVRPFYLRFRKGS